jgi:ABC-type branched-subunit amino acid transport system ATPase component/branched-subunit amino acid ABC-type transport system permease component
VSNHLVFLLLGLANGAVVAGFATAVLVAYRSSGVVNFATGAVALYAAYAYANLRSGRLLVIVPGLPETVGIGGELGFAPAAAIAIAQASLLGLLLYLGVFRPLRRATPVARSVASLGVNLAMVGLFAQRLGTSAVIVEPIFPREVWKIGDIAFPSDRLWFAATIVALCGALGLLARYTSFGLRTRAVAETEVGAYVSGVSPDRVAAINWMLASAVAGLAGILVAPIVPLIPVAYSLFIVPALAAAAAARFRWLAVALVIGLAIGMLQSELAYLTSLHSWLPQTGLPELVPLVLLLAVLVVGAKPLPSRGELIARTLGRAPRSPHPIRIALGCAAVTACVLPFVGRLWREGVYVSLIFAIIALSLVIITGFAGQVSLAQLTLAGVAAFSLATITEDWGVPFPIAPLLAAAASAVVGVVVGLPALRVRGLPVAVVTLALAVAVEALWFNNRFIIPAGGKNISGPELFGFDLRTRVGADFGRLQFGYLLLVVLTIVALGVAWLRSSQLGVAMLAVRADERAAASAGINVVAVKLMAFGLAAFVAGLGGAFLGYMQGNASGPPYTILVGFGVFAAVYVAGLTSISGAVLAGVLSFGGIVYMMFDRWLNVGGWYSTVAGAGLVVTIIRDPEGITGRFHAALARRAQRAAPPAGAVVLAADDDPPAAGRITAAGELRVDSMRVTYRGVVAVADVSFTVPAGSIVGLIGPNGAGKTTLLDAVCGFTESTGAVWLDDARLDGLPPHRRIRAGLGRTFQALNLYEDLSVAENVATGCAARWARPDGTASATVERVLAQLGLGELADRSVGELSQGQRQLVSIAKALAGDPRVLLLDEPAGGLDSSETVWLARRLRRIRDEGKTILIVDHDMSLILGLCDQVVVLDFGVQIAAGSPAAIENDPKVRAAYLGDTHSAVEELV